MGKRWQYGCLQIEIQDAVGTHPLEDQAASLYILTPMEDGQMGQIEVEGILALQLAHMLHACVILSSGEDEEWFVPNAGHPLHMRRQGALIEIARYPTYATDATSWLIEGGLYLVDFGVLLESLSAAVEWLMSDLSDEFADDDTVHVLIQQWERAWQRFSRLATFRRVYLMPAL